MEPCDEVDKTEISLEFPISQIGNRIQGNVQCDSVTEYEQPPLASAPEACKSVSPLCFLRDFALNASRKNAFQKDKPVTAPEAPMHFHAPGKMSFSDCAMFEQRNPTYPLEMTVFIRLYL